MATSENTTKLIEASAAVSESTEKTVEKQQCNNEKEGAVTRYFNFNPTNEREFVLDYEKEKTEDEKVKKLNIASCLMEKRIKIFATFSEGVKDYKNTITNLVHFLNRSLMSSVNQSVWINTTVAPDSVESDKSYEIVEIDISYMTSMGKITNIVKEAVKMFSTEDVKLKTKSETAVHIRLDNSVESDNTFIKGYAAASFIEFNATPNGEKKKKVFVKGMTFVNESIGFERSFISDCNDVLSINHVRTYSTTKNDKKNEFVTVLPFRNKFCFISYRIVDMTDGVLTVKRSITRIRIRNKEIADIIVPKGIYFTQRRDTIKVSDFSDIFIDICDKEQKTVLESYIDLEDKNLFEIDRFKEDAKILNKVIIGSLTTEE